MIAEALDDVGVREAIEHPVVDLFAEVLGQASYFAVATIGVGNIGLRVGGWSIRRRDWSFGSGDLVIGVHTITDLESGALTPAHPGLSPSEEEREKRRGEWGRNTCQGLLKKILRFTKIWSDLVR